MTLTDIASSLGASLLSTSPGQSERTRAPTAAATEALEQAGQRLEAQQSSTEVRLSAFGQLRSAVAQLQDSSKALTSSENTDTPEEARAAAEQFVNAFNNAQSTAQRTINGKPGTQADSTDGVLAGEGRAYVAASTLSRTLDSSSAEALRSIGINRERNGTLSIDQQRFAQALENDPQAVSKALAQAGQQVEQASSRQLAGESNLNRAIETLSTQSQQLEARQAAQRAFLESLQRASEQAANRFNFSAENGIRAYERIFAL